MKKTAKFGVTILAILIFFTILIIGLSRWISPTLIKEELSQQVYQSTGYPLIIQGNVKWSFTPLGITVQNVSINNTSEFGQTPFIKANEVRFAINLLPLWSKRVEIKNIFITGLDIHLIKNIYGKGNWEHFFDVRAKQQELNNKQRENNFNSRSLQINQLTIENGHVTFNNEQKRESMEFNAVHLKAKNITLDKPVPFELSFTFKQKDSTANINLKSTLTIGFLKNLWNFSNLTIEGTEASLLNEQPVIFSAFCNFVYNSQNSGFSITNLKAKLDKSTFTGNLTGTIDPTLFVTGNIQSPVLLIDDLLFKNAQAHLNINNHLISLDNLTAIFYEGTFAGNILINRQTQTPKITLNAQLTHASAQELLKNLLPKTPLFFTGTAGITTNLTFSAGPAETIRKTLNGNFSIDIQNGILHGINFPALIELGQAIIKQKTLPTLSNMNQTDFGHLKGTFQAQDGMIKNQDFALQSTQLNATGQGQIDLVHEKINYLINAGLVGHNTMIPIYIQGKLDNPQIGVNAQNIVHQALHDKIDLLKGKLSDKLQKLHLESLLQ